jgi:hypothetical protein
MLTNKGCLSIGVKGVNSFGGMVGWRFCLGLVEAGFFPGVMLLMSCWYKVIRRSHPIKTVAHKSSFSPPSFQNVSHVLHSLPDLGGVWWSLSRWEVTLHHRGSRDRRPRHHRFLRFTWYDLL